MSRQCWQGYVAKFRVDLVPTSEDDILVIQLAQERCYRAVMRIASPRPLERTSQTNALILVCKVARRFTVNLFRIATKIQAPGSEREFGLMHRRRHICAIVDKDLVPINLQ